VLAPQLRLKTIYGERAINEALQLARRRRAAPLLGIMAAALIVHFVAP
jgi:hypothetical protein